MTLKMVLLQNIAEGLSTYTALILSHPVDLVIFIPVDYRPAIISIFSSYQKTT